MKSKHLDGHAVDLMAYVDGGRWELNLYDEIADAMAEGARAVDVPIRWGLLGLFQTLLIGMALWNLQ